jgi:lipoprotein LprG
MLLAMLAGCAKKEQQPTAQLPDGATLISDASGIMREVQSAHVRIAAEGPVTGLPLRSADGDLTRAGDAKGTVQLEQLGNLIEYEFVVVGESIYLKGVTGGWQQLPVALASSFYDPSAILDPDRGVSKVLASATEATTEAEETVDGRATYRVGAKLDSTASALVPGVGPGAPAKLWVDKESKQLRRALLTVPGTEPGKTATVTIDFTDIGKPVTVSAP